MINLNELKKTTLEIAKKRIANGANLDNDFLKHCGGELVEAVNARYAFATGMNMTLNIRPVTKEISEAIDKLQADYACELADIIICVLNEAEKVHIDIEKAILKVVEKNRLRAEGKGDKK